MSTMPVTFMYLPVLQPKSQDVHCRQPLLGKRRTLYKNAPCCRRGPRNGSAIKITGSLETKSTGNCYGCGITLQTEQPDIAGYVQPEKYTLKRMHRQLDQLLCKRCQELSNGAMIPAVADFAQTVEGRSSKGSPDAALSERTMTGFEGKQLISPIELRESLKVVRGARALVVLLVDLLDASGSLLGRVRELVGGNPIVLIGTKADLLPQGTDEQEVADWLQAAAAFKKINAVSVHLVSARTGEGVSAAVAAIRRERKGRDVYVMGAANVGKSAFIRALVRDMSAASSRQYDPQATLRSKFLPVESAMPGTTLQLIPMKVFAAGGMLYDTPGLHLHHRMPHMLTPEENKALHPRRRLRPYVAPSLGQLLEPQPRSASGSSPGETLASYFWGGLIRIDVQQAPESLQLVFYGPPALKVTAQAATSSGRGPEHAIVPTEESHHSTADVSFGAESALLRGGMRLAKEVSFRVGGSGGGHEQVGDVAISGVSGWVSVLAAGRAGQRVELQVFAPKGIEVFSRPSIPVPLPLV